MRLPKLVELLCPWFLAVRRRVVPVVDEESKPFETGTWYGGQARVYDLDLHFTSSGLTNRFGQFFFSQLFLTYMPATPLLSFISPDTFFDSKKTTFACDA